MNRAPRSSVGDDSVPLPSAGGPPRAAAFPLSEEAGVGFGLSASRSLPLPRAAQGWRAHVSRERAGCRACCGSPSKGGRGRWNTLVNIAGRSVETTHRGVRSEWRPVERLSSVEEPGRLVLGFRAGAFLPKLGEGQVDLVRERVGSTFHAPLGIISSDGGGTELVASVVGPVHMAFMLGHFLKEGAGSFFGSINWMV